MKKRGLGGLKTLIIEDQKEKALALSNALHESFPTSEFEYCESLRSGLSSLIKNGKYDLLILDMSMPRFDPNPSSTGSVIPESFAGKEILSQMQLRKIDTPTVVVTQYSVFGDSKIELETLDSEFKEQYRSFYLGCVYYSSASINWKNDLINLIQNSKGSP